MKTILSTVYMFAGLVCIVTGYEVLRTEGLKEEQIHE